MKKIIIIIITVLFSLLAGVKIENEKEGISIAIDADGTLISSEILKPTKGGDVQGNGDKKTLFFIKENDETPLRMAFSTNGFEYYTNNDVYGERTLFDGDLYFTHITNPTVIYSAYNDMLYYNNVLQPDFDAIQPNYIFSSTYRLPQKKGANSVVSYADGFGDIVQTQAKHNGYRFHITGSYFNDRHKVTKSIIPFMENTFGNYLDMSNENLITLADEYLTEKGKKELNFSYDETDNNPFIEYKYDGTPLELITETANPGKSFAMGGQHTTKVWHRGVRGISSIFDDPKQTLENVGYVLDNEPDATMLHVITKDPNGTYSQTVSDANGKLLLNWVHDGTTPIITQYEYDARGNLLKEMTPLDGKSDDSAIKIRTEYEYDKRDRLKKKISPDAAPVEFFYDHADRITHVVNGNITIYNSYDTFGRLDSVYINPEYTLSTGALVSCDLIGRTYYTHVGALDDDITSLFIGEDLTTFQKIVGLNGYKGELRNLRGRSFASVVYNPATGVVTAGADGNIHDEPIVGLMSFDSKGNVEATYSYYKPLGWTKSTSTYDLLGGVVDAKTYKKYKATGLEQPDVYIENEYNSRGQLIAVHNKLKNRKLSSFTYNEQGEVKEKNVYDLYGGVLETFSYDYNVHGWSTRIKAGDLFTEELGYYNFGTASSVAENFNGNISYINMTYNTKDKDFSLQQSYTYDMANRLKSVEATTSGTSSDVIAYIDSLTESFEYDHNGRITNKKRGKDNSIQDFSYNYSESVDNTWGSSSNQSHRLSGVSGHHTGFESNNYEYDSNGNMLIDRSKKMAVYYNYQNLPVRFEFYEDVNDLDINTRVGTPVSVVDMVYDGAGNRISKTEVIDAKENGVQITKKKGTLYSGTFVYEGETTDLSADIEYSLSYVNVPNGRIEYENGVEKEKYAYITDHLGSTRMTINSSGDVVEADLYTAYGEEIVVDNTKETKEKFTGKELDKDGAIDGITKGLELNYFGWRYYDPTIAMWTTLDPMEQFWSGYSYGFSPVNGIDPDGRWLTVTQNVDENGDYSYHIHFTAAVYYDHYFDLTEKEAENVIDHLEASLQSHIKKELNNVTVTTELRYVHDLRDAKNSEHRIHITNNRLIDSEGRELLGLVIDAGPGKGSRDLMISRYSESSGLNGWANVSTFPHEFLHLCGVGHTGGMDVMSRLNFIGKGFKLLRDDIPVAKIYGKDLGLYIYEAYKKGNLNLMHVVNPHMLNREIKVKRREFK